MRFLSLMILTSTVLNAQPRLAGNLIDSTLFDLSGQRKQSPHADSYILERSDRDIGAVSLPHIWFLSQRGDSLSFDDFNTHLPLRMKAYLILSIDWDGTIWKAQLLSKDTTNYYRVDFTDIAKRVRATPGMWRGIPLAFPVSVPLHNP